MVTNWTNWEEDEAPTDFNYWNDRQMGDVDPNMSYDAFGSPALRGSAAATQADPTGLAEMYLDAQKSGKSGKGLLDALFKDSKGNIDLGKLATLFVGAKTFKDGPRSMPKAGFQGTIPKYTATRKMVTAPPATLVDAITKRRPGSSGIDWKGDVVYGKAGGGPIVRPVIPQRTATRTMMTAPPAMVGGIARRPGSSAVKWNSGVTFARKPMAEGGLADSPYLRGETDGMADEIPAQIEDDQPAALSHGEFVIPADVVSHLGNGNSDAGAKKLYEMMDRIREARTGTKEQGKRIDPEEFTSGGLAYAAGGGVQHYDGGGNVMSQETTLSDYAAPYVTDMLSKGQALSEMPYEQYTGATTADASSLQKKAFTGLENVNFPGNFGGSFSAQGAPQTPAAGGVNTAGMSGTNTTVGADGKPVTQNNGIGVAQQYMNPYLDQVLRPQLNEMTRQSQINLQPGLAKLTAAGGYGGGRQAIMESEAGRNLLQEQNTTIGKGYATAYDKALDQFNKEQDQGVGLANLLATQGATQRDIEQQGLTADKTAFEEARANPFKMVQFQQSLLDKLPLETTNYGGLTPSKLEEISANMKTTNELLTRLGLTPK
jgi:hypothetical protein